MQKITEVKNYKDLLLIMQKATEVNDYKDILFIDIFKRIVDTGLMNSNVPLWCPELGNVRINYMNDTAKTISFTQVDGTIGGVVEQYGRYIYFHPDYSGYDERMCHLFPSSVFSKEIDWISGITKMFIEDEQYEGTVFDVKFLNEDTHRILLKKDNKFIDINGDPVEDEEKLRTAEMKIVDQNAKDEFMRMLYCKKGSNVKPELKVKDIRTGIDYYIYDAFERELIIDLIQLFDKKQSEENIGKCE